MSNTPRILVFDSGVGGLTIAESILSHHPYCSITYASDNAAFPYGTKTEAELISRVDHVLRHLQKHKPSDMIVIACNTASTVALPVIRERFNIPIIGVVPAVKPAAKISKTGVIGLLATPGTIARRYTQDLIDEFANDSLIIKLGSSELVILAESALRERVGNDDITTLEKIIQPLKQYKDMDTVVLACTHFPLLIKQLKSLMPNVDHWVDSGDAIARRVGFWIDELKLNTNNTTPEGHLSIFTAQDDTIERLRPALARRKLGNIHYELLENLNATSSL